MNFSVPRTATHAFAYRLLYPNTLVSKLWGGITGTMGYLFGNSISKSLIPGQTLSEDESFVQGTRSLEAQFARDLSKPDNAVITAEKHVVTTHDDADLETIEFTHADQARKAPADRQYIIYLVGNSMCYQDILKDCLSDTKALGFNAVAYNYRNVMDSSGDISSKFDLISDLISQIERLKKQGVRSENIHLCGHSVGAGIATVVAYVYAKMGENIKLFNGRSFGQFSDILYYQQPEGWKRKIWGNFAKLKLKFADLDIDALSAYLEIPEQNKSFITVVKEASEPNSMPDGVIDVPASLFYGLQQRRQLPADLHPNASAEELRYQGALVFSHNRIAGCGHNDPIKYLVRKGAQGDEQQKALDNAQEYYREFFSPAYRAKKAGL